MKHTPGIWEIHITRWPDGTLNGTPTVYASNDNSEGRHVCQLYDNGQLDANARLIAAAPDLLEALKDIEYALSHIATGRITGTAYKKFIEGLGKDDSILTAARAAIAKAVKP